MCQGWELVYGFADLMWSCDVWVSGFRNCVKYKGFVCKQLKKTVMYSDMQIEANTSNIGTKKI